MSRKSLRGADSGIHFIWMEDRNTFEYLMNDDIPLNERTKVATVLHWLHDGMQWRPMTDAEVDHHHGLADGGGNGRMAAFPGGDFLEGAAAPARRLRTHAVTTTPSPSSLA